MSQYTEYNLTDPVVHPLDKCQKCHSGMGPIRVFVGTGERFADRGRICQSCSDVKNCHYTAFLTEQAYNFEDAELLASRLTLQRTYPGYSAQELRRDQILRPAIPPPALPPISPGQIDCANLDCSSKTGNRTRGHRQCIERFCKGCCETARAKAESTGGRRAHCIAHKVPSCDISREMVSLSQENSAVRPHALQNSSAAHISGPARSLANTASRPFEHIPATSSTCPSVATRGPLASLSAANSVRVPAEVPAGRSATAVLQHPGSVHDAFAPSQRAPGRRLARPMSSLWENKYSQAKTQRQEVKTNKARNEEMSSALKKTVTFVIWFENGVDPVRLQHHVDTYPQLMLESLGSVFIEPFQLSPTSLLDKYDTLKKLWSTITIRTVIVVDTQQPTLLRLRPDIWTPLKDCPQLIEEIEDQVRKLSGTKRSAHTLVSPPKKTIRTADSSSARDLTHPCPDVISLSSSDSETPHDQSSPLPRTKAKSSRKTAKLPTHHAQPPPFPLDRKGDALEAEHRSWPNDFYVVEIRDGLKKMEKMKAQQAIDYIHSFAEVFGVPMKKTSYNKYKSLWNGNDIPTKLRERFVKYGEQKAGLWKNLLKALKTYKSEDEGEVSDLFTDHSSTAHQDKGKQREVSPVSAPDDILATGDAADISAPVMGDSSDSDDDVVTPRCPYCDEKIPFAPTQRMIQMDNALRKITYLNPSPKNPHHRTAESFRVYFSYCELHRWAREELPKAQADGWPIEPDFASLWNRIWDLQADLLQIAANPKKNEFFIKTRELYTPGLSSRKVESLGAQYKRFEGKSAGYYGGTGWVILELILKHLIPDGQIDLTRAKPLSYNALVSEVLLPETTVRLIQEDLSLQRADAIDVFHDSSRFGSVAHPGTGEDPHIDNIQMMLSSIMALVSSDLEEYQNSQSALGFEDWIGLRADVRFGRSSTDNGTQASTAESSGLAPVDDSKHSGSPSQTAVQSPDADSRHHGGRVSGPAPAPNVKIEDDEIDLMSGSLDLPAVAGAIDGFHIVQGGDRVTYEIDD
ncbi:hypothetical protein GLOTRDRAFT_97252 [Gloeophyllum trabeum ATCC 11539]|uniref:Restriction of telomere capping protein 4 n=1 Tax=Gloeophyllum trabeum (strain ATCC 11539 / FP-39264 / Madison 617) TaxID=670483 RepID=S7PRR4_GLOTA|nr:uncharacterized protein GLOTRDRAFT_97252 [Gloeophyllum trabeum ATCC 11539]EPQ50067.1 hypothetical protein GLOTRDRAFT_97252 [Gloeophyllum trabeum ATCC 11539]